MLRLSIRRCLAFLSVSLACAATAQAQTQVYVLDEGTVPVSCSGHPCYGPTIHLINAVTGHDLGSIQAAALGQKGSSMRLSSDGGMLFVTSNNYFDFSTQGRLSIVDTVTKASVAQITVGAGAADVAILPDNSRAYVVNSNANTVSVVDLTSFTVVATVAVIRTREDCRLPRRECRLRHEQRIRNGDENRHRQQHRRRQHHRRDDAEGARSQS